MGRGFSALVLWRKVVLVNSGYATRAESQRGTVSQGGLFAVSALAMLGDVQAGVLIFLVNAQADDAIDQFEEDDGYNSREEGGEEHADGLVDKLVNSSGQGNGTFRRMEG